MFLRSPSTTTITDVIEEMMGQTGREVFASSSAISFHLHGADPHYRINGSEYQATPDGTRAFSAALTIPTKFIERQAGDPEFQDYVLNRMMEGSSHEDVVFTIVIGDSGIFEVRPQTLRVLNPIAIAEVASRVISPDAIVTDYWNVPDKEFRLDVMVPEGFDRGWGGDPKVDDMTGAGIRFFLNTKYQGKFHSPTVSEFFYRLVCTNGYERALDGATFDVRGQTLEYIMADLEVVANQAFARAENSIAAFYDMRSAVVQHPEQRLVRLGHEMALPAKAINALVETVPSYTDESGQMSEFDLVNLITNRANDPLVKQDSLRRRLQVAGGSVISSHEERCTSCQSLLVH